MLWCYDLCFTYQSSALTEAVYFIYYVITQYVHMKNAEYVLIFLCLPIFSIMKWFLVILKMYQFFCWCLFVFLQIVLWTHRFQHTGILIHYPYYLCWSSTSPIFARADLFEFATGPFLCDPRGLWQLWSYVELHSILG